MKEPKKEWSVIDGVHFSVRHRIGNLVSIYTASPDGGTMYCFTLTKEGIEKFMELLDDSISEPMVPEFPEISKEMN